MVWAGFWAQHGPAQDTASAAGTTGRERTRFPLLPWRQYGARENTLPATGYNRPVLVLARDFTATNGHNRDSRAQDNGEQQEERKGAEVIQDCSGSQGNMSKNPDRHRVEATEKQVTGKLRWIPGRERHVQETESAV